MPVSLLQETYPSSPPVWFAESEETSVTNAVQILSNTNGRDNHVINQVSTYGRFRNLLPVNWQSQTKSLQVGILLRELCRLHNVPLPPDIDNLALPLQTPPPSASPFAASRDQVVVERGRWRTPRQRGDRFGSGGDRGSHRRERTGERGRWGLAAGNGWCTQYKQGEL